MLVVVVSFKGDLGVSPDCLLYTEDISQLFYLPIDQYLETTPFLLVAALSLPIVGDLHVQV